MSEWFNHGNSSKQKKFHLFPKKFIFGQIFFASLHPTQNLMVILQNICIQNLSGMQLTNLILIFPNFILFVPIVTWTLSNYHFPMFYPATLSCCLLTDTSCFSKLHCWEKLKMQRLEFLKIITCCTFLIPYSLIIIKSNSNDFSLQIPSSGSLFSVKIWLQEIPIVELSSYPPEQKLFENLPLSEGACPTGEWGTYSIQGCK